MLTRTVILAESNSVSDVEVNGRQYKALYSAKLPAAPLTDQAPFPFQVLVLEFSGIDFIDIGLALNVIIPVKEELTRQGKAVVLKNPCREVLAIIQAAIALRREETGAQDCVLVNTEQRYLLVGHVEPNLMRAFSLITRQGSLTAAELHKLTGVPICNASTRLKRLLDAGVVVRQRLVDKTGAFHLYTLPEIA